MEECDAEKFCLIFRILERNYKTFDVAIAYMSGLLWANNTKELDYMIEEYGRFAKNIAYKQILYGRENNTDSVSQELYDTLLGYYEKHQTRNGNNQLVHQIRMLKIKKFIREKKYQEILNVLDKIDEKLTKAREVQIEYYKGLCLCSLNQKDKGISLLKWVINNGNTLCYVEMAKKLNEEIEEMI